MYIVHVFAHVKPDQVEAFRQATIINAQTSCATEAGVVRFDLLQQQDDPTRFCLVEVYRTADDAAMHKQTPHYLKWRDAVGPMMAEPRSSLRFTNIFPEDQQWQQVCQDLVEVRPARPRHPKDVSPIRP
ncbi:MAG: putative quinol monooxygenase [Sedimentisphaerales bacterium]|jgi:quinol monooxygenase YgiN|nr:putative quinol monooxygenase [Sedimentisphaerales bacterium]